MGEVYKVSNENIKKFMEKVANDKQLLAKLSRIRDSDEAYKVASDVQDGFTKEEFVAEMKKAYDESMKDLSEEDMVKMAGGLDQETKESITYAATGGSAATIVIGAFAAAT